MKTRRTCSLLTLALPLGFPAIAQENSQQPVSTTQPDSEISRTVEADNTLDVVFVTARRRVERLTDVPGSASALSSDYLQKRGSPRTARDILAGEAGVRLGQMSEFSLLLVAVALQAQTISQQAANLVQLATLITFVVSSAFVVLRYPSPIALSERLRRD